LQLAVPIDAAPWQPLHASHLRAAGEEREGAKSVIFRTLEAMDKPATTAELWTKLEVGWPVPRGAPRLPEPRAVGGGLYAAAMRLSAADKGCVCGCVAVPCCACQSPVRGQRPRPASLTPTARCAGCRTDEEQAVYEADAPPGLRPPARCMPCRCTGALHALVLHGLVSLTLHSGSAPAVGPATAQATAGAASVRRMRCVTARDPLSIRAPRR